MGLPDFPLGAVVAMNVLDTRESDQPQYDDGYSGDYVGDGLDGDDDPGW